MTASIGFFIAAVLSLFSTQVIYVDLRDWKDNTRPLWHAIVWAFILNMCTSYMSRCLIGWGWV